LSNSQQSQSDYIILSIFDARLQNLTSEPLGQHAVRVTVSAAKGAGILPLISRKNTSSYWHVRTSIGWESTSILQWWASRCSRICSSICDPFELFADLSTFDHKQVRQNLKSDEEYPDSWPVSTLLRYQGSVCYCRHVLRRLRCGDALSHRLSGVELIASCCTLTDCSRCGDAFSKVSPAVLFCTRSLRPQSRCWRSAASIVFESLQFGRRELRRDPVVLGGGVQKLWFPQWISEKTPIQILNVVTGYSERKRKQKVPPVHLCSSAFSPSAWSWHRISWIQFRN